MNFTGKQLIMTMGVAAQSLLSFSAEIPDSSRVVDLDEVVVVSHPKEHVLLRRLPLASSMIGAEQINMQGYNSLDKLGGQVPSLSIPSYGSRLTSSMYLRGVGSRLGSVSVGMYYNQVPIILKSACNRYLYNLERADVLRGPQGTLYGMNVESGLIRLFTASPLGEPSTWARLGGGSGNSMVAEAGSSIRLNGKSAVSVAAFYNAQKGFFNHATLDEKTDKSRETGASVRWVYLLSGHLTLDAFTDFQYVSQNGFGYGKYNPTEKTWEDANSLQLNTYNRKMLVSGINLTWQKDNAMVQSTTGYQYLDDNMSMDQDYLPGDYMLLQQKQHTQALSQELTSRVQAGQGWKVICGAFFSYQWLKTTAPVYFGEDMNRSIASNMLGNIPSMPSAVLARLQIKDNYVPGQFHTPVMNFALYHESEIAVCDRLRLTLGLRYDYQRHSIDYDTYSTFTMGHVYRSTLQGSDRVGYHQLLPKVALSYEIEPRQTVYVSLTKGYRAGGYNLQMFSDIFMTEQKGMGSALAALMRNDMDITHDAEDCQEVVNTITYKPETTWNLEAGAHLNLMDNKVALDLATYCTRISNQQLSVMAGNFKYGRMMVNAGRSAACGAEIGVHGKACNNALDWHLNYAYTHAVFRDYQSDGKDYRNDKVPYVPAHTFSALADYTCGMGDNSRLLKRIVIGVDVAGNGKTYWDIDNRYFQNLYAQLGAHLLLDMGWVRVNLWGRNLTNTKYNTFLVESSVDGVSNTFAQRGLPIHLGVDFYVKL
ncbi:MAG: TonB-dependent receptor [Prevotella sp.]